MKSKKILVTGGAGYIGSHTLIELSKAGYDFIVYDNLSNSSLESLKRVEKIIEKDVTFEQGDLRDEKKLENFFSKYEIDSVIHFAGLKAVEESIQKPLEYYDSNINGTLTLLKTMKKFNCKKIVFSSSANVYGNPEKMPVDESFPVGNVTNPYGRTKYFIEEILKDLFKSDKTFNIVILRYFNPVGAHESGLIGEDPNGLPTNLMPIIVQTALGKRDFVNIFGNDYDTIDGTGVRDFIHVIDLAFGHVKAIEYLNKSNIQEKFVTVNLGTGDGHTVLEMLKTFEKINRVKINYKIVGRREGDIAVSFADTSNAKKLLDWEAKKSIEEMCEDVWRWQRNNPDGYKKENN